MIQKNVACGVVQYYINIGTSRKPKYKYKGVIIKGMWAYEAGFDIADWDNNVHQDVILMNGDNGKRVLYNKIFLDKLAPRNYVQ